MLRLILLRQAIVLGLLYFSKQFFHKVETQLLLKNQNNQCKRNYKIQASFYQQQYIIFIMTDSFTKQQNQYLQQLLFNHQSIDRVEKFIGQANGIYQRQIENGDFSIKSKSYSLSSTPNFNRVNRCIDNNFECKSSQSQQANSNNPSINIKEIKTLTEEQRRQFLKKIKKQKDSLQQKKEEQIRWKQLKKNAQAQQQYKKQREQNQKRQLKRRQIQKRLEELNEQKIRRQIEIKNNNRQFQQISKKKILLHRIQENYKLAEASSLKQRGEQLNQIREKHRPISKSEFKEHIIRIHQYLEKKQQTKLKQQQLNPANINQFYKSRWYKEIMNEEKIDESKVQQQKKNIIKILREKGKQYSQFIRIYYSPLIDDTLVQSLQQGQNKPIKRKKAIQIRQMGLNNLKYSKQSAISREQAQIKNNNKLKGNYDNQNKHKNYLQDLKINRRSNSLQQLFLDKGKESVSKQKIQYLAQKLEQKARQSQKLHKIRRQVLSEDVDEMYMRALNAKLNLLGK